MPTQTPVNRRPKLFDRLIEQLEFNLKAIKAEYYIRLEDGTILANMEVQEPKKAKRNYTQPPGTYTNHFEPRIKDMKVADVWVVPVPEGWLLPNCQSAICNIAAKLWGAGSVTTAMDREAGAVEILRNF